MLEDGVDPAVSVRCAGGQQHRGREVPRLQLDDQLAAVPRELVQPALEGAAGLLEPAGVVQRAAQLEGQRGPVSGIERLCDRRFEVLDRASRRGVCFGSGELGQHLDSRAVRGRFTQRPLQIRHRRARHALLGRVSRGTPERIDDRGVARRHGQQQVRRHLLARNARGEQERGRAACSAALRWRVSPPYTAARNNGWENSSGSPAARMCARDR